MKQPPTISVAIIAHLADDALSDGNTGVKVRGRLQVFQLVLQSLFMFNRMDNIKIAIFDTGDGAESTVLPLISAFGFTGMTLSSQPGFHTADVASQQRLWLRYRRAGEWSAKFRFRARRFLEACEAALRYATQQNTDYLLALEGDTIVFGRDYMQRFLDAVAGRPIACSSSPGEVFTDLWIADAQQALARFPQVFAAFREPFSTERAFAQAFPDRGNLDALIVGQKALDQQVQKQRSAVQLPPRYYRLYPYSWITHLSEEDIADIERYFAEWIASAPEEARRRSGTACSSAARADQVQGPGPLVQALNYICRPVRDAGMRRAISGSRSLIIEIRGGGLCDHLAYSALPRLLWERFKTTTSISLRSACEDAEVWRFIWGENPFVRFTEAPGWSDDAARPGGDPAKQAACLMRRLGLADSGVPQVYHDPLPVEALQGATVVAIGPWDRTPGPARHARWRAHVLGALKANVSPFTLLVYAGRETDLEKEVIQACACTVHRVTSLDAYADALCAAERRWLFSRGATALAAALGLGPSSAVERTT